MATITCGRCGKSSEPMEFAPVGGDLGLTIQNKVCPTCWQEWKGQELLYINHYGLTMADPEDRRKLTEAMKEHLNL